MRTDRPLALALALVVLLTAAAPTALGAHGALTVESTQDPATGAATLTVTHNGTAVENATVVVSSETAYAGNGTYATDADGTVSLPEPNETVTVTVEATDDGVSTTETVELVPRSASLDVTAEQADDGTATVTVTQYGNAVENATVNVSTAGDYAGDGSYETDANGTVSLPAPAESVTANVTATYDGLSAETTVDLAGTGDLTVTVDQYTDGTATVTVTDGNGTVENASVVVEANESYDGTGNYTTSEFGLVDLPAPNESVEVTVTATHEGAEATTTTTLLPPERVNQTVTGPFGQRVSAFVHSLLDDSEAGAGIEIANFVLAHNPGNPPEHAGPPEDAGRPANAGPPAHAGGNQTAGNATAGGPPDDAGGPPDHAGGDDETGSNADSSSGGNGGGGPPDHAKGN